MELRHSPPAADLKIRTAREDDLDRLVSIHAAAFPDARSRDARRRNFTENVRGALGDALVAERLGSVVGHAFAFRMATWIAGSQVQLGGIASVGVAPEARGTGVARTLMYAISEELRARAAPVALLYPFRHRFYRRLGYGLVCEMRRLRVAPSAFPAATPGAMRNASRAEDIAAVKRCYQRTAEKSNGMLARREPVWRAALAPEGRQLTIVPARTGEVEGYLLYMYVSPTEGLTQEIEILELVAETDRARLALYGFLNAQRDQVAYVRYVVDAHDPIVAVLDEPRGPYADAIRALVPVVGEVGAGPMLRIIDLPGALCARGYGHDGVLTIRATDSYAPGGSMACTLRVRGGRGTAEPDRGGAQLATDVATLAQIYTGYLRATDAVRLGRARADTWETARLADAMFATGSFFPLDVF